MDKDNEFIKILEYVFNNEDYLLSLTYDYGFFNDEYINKVLEVTLDYYIATRDTNVILSPQLIQKNYNDLNHRCMSKKEIENVIDKGFLTHSFNGIEKDYIEKYGFNYLENLNEQERTKVEDIRKKLNILEEEIIKSYYMSYREMDNDPSIVNQEIFMTVPGAKTIHYSKTVPERLYFGPINYHYYDKFPIVVGESKKEYLIRLIKYHLDHTMSFNYTETELLKIADEVLEYYTKKSSNIAFIPISDLLDKPVYSLNYGNGSKDKLKEYCDTIKNKKFFLETAFTIKEKDRKEMNDIGNLVTLRKFIPRDSILFMNYPDMYNIKQKYLKKIGIPSGTLVSYHKCKKISFSNNQKNIINKYYN